MELHTGTMKRIIKNIDEIFDIVLEIGASDIILTPGVPPAAWIAGRMKLISTETVQPSTIKEIFFPLLTDEQSKRLKEYGDIDFAVGKHGKGRFRINLHRQRGTIGAALRYVPHLIPDFEQLRLPKRIIDFAKLPHGLVLVTGGAAAGKSTTLAAVIQFMNQHYKYHIVTLEDPIEYIFHHEKSIIEQREIGLDVPSFASALRHVVRQRPDVVLIGEMRDLETISAVLTAAETGHLILATLHTSTAVQTIDRIIDVFPAEQQGQIRIQLSNTLQGVVCQKLFHDRLTDGLIPAAEIMITTPAIRRAIRDKETHLIGGMIETGKNMGMQRMDDSILQLARAGHISPEEAIVNAEDQEKMVRILAA